MVTRLQIIDHMLSVIGESGVSTLSSLHPSVQTAQRILDTTDLDFQGRGWWFNREMDLVLVQDENGEVIIPDNALDFKLSGVEQATSPKEKARYVKRGSKIYDAVRHTFNIGTSVTCDIITQIAIEDLPAVAGTYLMHKAAENIYVDDEGDTFKTTKLEKRTSEAWQTLLAAHLKTLAVNGLDNHVARQLRAGTGTGRNPNLIGG